MLFVLLIRMLSWLSLVMIVLISVCVFFGWCMLFGMVRACWLSVWMFVVVCFSGLGW